MINLRDYSFYRAYPINGGGAYVTLLKGQQILIQKLLGDGQEIVYCLKTGNYDTVVAGLSGYTYVALSELI